MPREHFILKLEQVDIETNSIWFQQNDATCPIAREITDLLRTTFQDRILRNGTQNWPI